MSLLHKESLLHERQLAKDEKSHNHKQIRKKVVKVKQRCTSNVSVMNINQEE